eukprot:CAMPEP_0119355614 /NCGR_PEP_ID=MMETSP1334-20130426/4411_1 /TAXON_ID=127549 /ORGANISM="Calcidiscus leptoporus, Strain RCC1130" /LENGTH=507 /DNA_ID=CAMNT_0007369473 /DNA_START=24 /DNA_END=1547 /DNA_ORIENTATION=-
MTTIVALLCSATCAYAFSSLTEGNAPPSAPPDQTFEQLWTGKHLESFEDWYATGRTGWNKYTYFYQTPVHPVWSMLNLQQLTHTKVVPKGTEVNTVPANACDNSCVSFWFNFVFPTDDASVPKEIRGMDLRKLLTLSMTDGFLVMHQGKIVGELYAPGGQTAGSNHRMYSGTKSYCGLMAQMLATGGALNTSALVTDIVPALDGSGYEGATVRQVMDMTAEIQWNEIIDPNCLTDRIWEETRADLRAEKPWQMTKDCEFMQYDLVNGIGNFRPALIHEWYDGKVFEPPGPRTIQGYLRHIKKHPDNLEHGKKFTYRTAHTDVLAWIVNETVTGLGYHGPEHYFEKEIWSKLGQNLDALFVTDASNVVYWGAGASVSLRDAANFGEMLRNGGKSTAGEQVVDPRVIEEIFNPSEDIPPEAHEWGGGFYRSQFYNWKGAAIQVGYFGQFVYINRKLDLVVVKHSHDPCFAAGCKPGEFKEGYPEEAVPGKHVLFDAFAYIGKYLAASSS